jgi:1,4-alpha-glucan branching enzyme
MGGEFGQYNEWNFQKSLDWNLLEFYPHQNTQTYFKDLNSFYKNTPSLYQNAFTQEGFEWISYDDHENSVMSYIRKGYKTEDDVIVVCNLTPSIRKKYRIGIPKTGKIKEIFNSDAEKYGGTGIGNKRQITIKNTPWNGKEFSAEITLPPLAIIAFMYSH